jgi:hypothetical protein
MRNPLHALQAGAGPCRFENDNAHGPYAVESQDRASSAWTEHHHSGDHGKALEQQQAWMPLVRAIETMPSFKLSD